MHIICLERLAATLIFKTNKTRMSVLLRLDNATAVAYIMTWEEQSLISRHRQHLLMRCLEKSIDIIAQHKPAFRYMIDDAESQTIIDQLDWQLNIEQDLDYQSLCSHRDGHVHIASAFSAGTQIPNRCLPARQGLKLRGMAIGNPLWSRVGFIPKCR